MKFTRLSGALLAVALSFAVTGVASASPRTALTLTIAAPNGAVESVVLACDPPAGTHPKAKRACAELHAARGDFDELPGTPAPSFCTMEYLPVVAVAKGRWRGEPVRWQREFGNTCMLHTETGAVFLF